MANISGTNGADTLVGTNDDDVISGANDDDLIQGLDGNDSLSGDDGDDTLEGGAGDDTLIGGNGDNLLIGGDGNDSIVAGRVSALSTGASTVVGGAGDDTITGANSDTDTLLTYRDATSSVTVTEDSFNSSGTIQGAATGNDEFNNINDFELTDFDDVFIGTGLSGSSVVYTLDTAAGNDFVQSGSINIDVDGGAGEDTLSLSAANSVDLETGAISSNIRTGSAVNFEHVINDGNAATMSGTSGSNSLTGGRFDDTISGLDGDDTLVGRDGVDTLEGGAGNDVLYAGDGLSATGPDGVNDLLTGGTGDDTLIGGQAVRANYAEAAGAVQVDLAAGTATGADGNDVLIEIDWVLGSAFDDEITGNENANQLTGNDGNDLLVGRGGNDALLGGEGADTLDGGDGADSLVAGLGDDDLSGGDGDDWLRADDGNDTIAGGAGSDSLFGGAGDDVLMGGSGTRDVIDGGDGIDLASYSDATSAVNVDLAESTVTSAFGNDSIRNVENVDGSDFDDVLRGDEVNNFFAGLDGDDTLFGAGGNDTLLGGAGADVFESSDGDNIFAGGTLVGNFYQDDDSDDLVSYETEAVAVQVDLGGGAVFGQVDQPVGLAVGEGTDTLAGIEDVIGSEFGDTLSGSVEDNEIFGGDGDDQIDGDAGDDLLEGNTGSDTLAGGGGNDTVLAGTEDDVVSGDAGSDSIDGGSGNDIIYGDTTEFEIDFINGTTTEINPGEFQLTPDENVQGGSIASSESQSLEDDLQFSFQINLGDDDAGADGLAFVLHNNPGGFTQTGQLGGGLGASGIENSLAIQFDTFSNPNGDGLNGGLAEPVQDHTQLTFTDSNGNEGQLTTPTELGNIEDGAWHDVVVSWDVSTQTLSWTFDGTEVGSHTFPPLSVGSITDILGGPEVFVYVSASTGGRSNEQSIRDIEVEVGEQTEFDDTIDGGEGDDLIFGQDGDDSIQGGDGSDTIDGGVGADTIIAGAGDDLILGSTGADQISAGTGTDTLSWRDEDGVTTVTDVVSVTVDTSGDGSVLNTNGEIGVFDGIQHLVADENQNDDPTSADTLTFSTTELSRTDIQGLDDNSAGTFTPSNGDPVVNFGPNVGQTPLSAILADNQPGTIRITSGDESGQIGGVSFENFETINFDIICFASGSLISTPTGQKPVEELKVGDLVDTVDNGAQPVRWIQSRHLSKATLEANPHLRPVLIRAGALGAGLPERDLLVSPQHRLLVSSKLAERMFGRQQVLIAAKQLLELEGFDFAECETVTYVHFLCDKHEIVYGEGAPCESLYVGEQTLKSLGADEVQEIAQLFPELLGCDALTQMVPARHLVSGRRGRKFATRSANAKRCVLDQFDGPITHHKSAA